MRISDWSSDVCSSDLCYTSRVDDSRIVNVAHYTAANPGKEGSVMLVTFALAGQTFFALNGGPDVRFNESVSLLVECDTQQEVDRLWSRLTEGGTEARSEEHTSELQSLMRSSYAVYCFKNKTES